MRRFGRALVKWSTVLSARGSIAGKGLPAPYSHIDIARIKFQSATDTACALRGNQRRAAADERVIDEIAGRAVVEHGPAHALDRLLRAVRCFAVLAAAGNRPQRRLFAVSRPIALAAHRVPARLVLPVIVAASDHQTFLRPDNLSANSKSLA